MLTKTIKLMGMAAIAAAAMAFASCSPSGPRTVDYPSINFANSSTLDIASVELNDSCTVLTMNASYRPGYWIRIAGDSYLVADGKQYAMTSTDGITPDSEFWMPESGKASFKLIFEPLPFSTQKFDFIEGNDPMAFKLWDIDISGKKTAEYPDGLPKELQTKFADGPVPEPVFELGNTTINFHLLPNRNDIKVPANLYVNTIDNKQEEYPVQFDNSGNASVSFEQYGTASAFLVNTDMGRIIASLTLSPGETVDCYIDMRQTGAYAMSSRPDSLKIKQTNSYHNGHYSNYDRMRSMENKYYGLQLRNGKFADYHLNNDQYLDMVKSLYDNYSDSISKSSVPQMSKEYQQLRLQNQVMEAIAQYRYLMGHFYRNAIGNWRAVVPLDSINANLTADDYAKVTKWFDTANPKLLMLEPSMGIINWNEYGTEGDLSKSIKLYGEMTAKARRQELTEADLDSLRTLSNPFFAEACDSLNQRTKREYLRLQEIASVTPTPEVADDKVFDAIIAQHKGKVVVVDLWNTWCGPCRAAISANEPLKEGELSSDDIVWIYIADESSDHPKYLSMIPDIKGIHYKVTEDQIAKIRNRFNVDGIPYYILVDRNGKAEGRPDIRDHSKYVEAIKSKL